MTLKLVIKTKFHYGFLAFCIDETKKIEKNEIHSKAENIHSHALYCADHVGVYILQAVSGRVISQYAIPVSVHSSWDSA